MLEKYVWMLFAPLCHLCRTFALLCNEVGVDPRYKLRVWLQLPCVKSSIEELGITPRGVQCVASEHNEQRKNDYCALNLSSRSSFASTSCMERQEAYMQVRSFCNQSASSIFSQPCRPGLLRCLSRAESYFSLSSETIAVEIAKAQAEFQLKRVSHIR